MGHTNAPGGPDPAAAPLRTVGRARAEAVVTRRPMTTADGDGRRPIWETALLFRALGALVIAVALLLLPLGRYRWPIVAVVASLCPLSLVVARMARRRGHLPTLPVYVSFGIIVVVVALAPAVFAPAMAVVTANLAFLATTFGRRRAIVMFAVVAPVLTTIALVERPPYADGALLLWLFASITTVAILGEALEAGSQISDRYHALVDRLDVVVWEGTAAHVEFVNERVRALLGFPPEHFVGTSELRRLVHPDDHGVLAEHERQVEAGRDHELCYRLRNAAGELRWVIEQVTVERRAEGPAKVRGVLLDVTDRIAAEAQAGQLADLFDSIRLGLAIVQLADSTDDTSLRFLAVNPAVRAFTVKDPEVLVGARVLDFYPHFLEAGVISGVAAAIRDGRRYELGPLLITPRGRAQSWIHLRAFAISGSSAAISIEDVTDREEANLALRYQADHDELTGLPNRSTLSRRLARSLDEARQGGRAVALLVMDLDQFKEVNDALGHHHGDRLLIELGRRLAASLPAADIVARLGGDEFAVLLTGDTLPAQARTVAASVVDALEQPVDVDGVRLQTNVSVGIATFPVDATDAVTLIQRADIAMYTAKRSSTGVAFYAAEDDRSSVRRLTLLGELRHGIGAGELVTHYQPVIDLTTASIVGAEALVRWHHPTLGLLQPAEFIELAEVSALIGPLVRTVAEQALADAATWHAHGHRLPVTVNLSVRNLYDPQLGAWLIRMIDRFGLPPAALRVELTESALMDDPVLATSMLAALRARGSEVSIDDFGTGYSSLSMLRRLPVDELKIDRSFVQDLEQRDATLVRSIIDLGHALGLRVVAEGVENARVLATLAELGCDRAQGYLISRALPSDRFLDLVEQPPEHLAELLQPLAASAAARRSGGTVTRLARRSGA
jgi:diguanylate cyclase (GGDEF)-like protein/PAS domain S-box-containing protein